MTPEERAIEDGTEEKTQIVIHNETKSAPQSSLIPLASGGEDDKIEESEEEEAAERNESAKKKIEEEEKEGEEEREEEGDEDEKAKVKSIWNTITNPFGAFTNSKTSNESTTPFVSMNDEEEGIGEDNITVAEENITSQDEEEEKSLWDKLVGDNDDVKDVENNATGPIIHAEVSNP